ARASTAARLSREAAPTSWHIDPARARPARHAQAWSAMEKPRLRRQRSPTMVRLQEPWPVRARSGPHAIPLGIALALERAPGGDSGLRLRQRGDEGALRDLIALACGEFGDAAGAGRVQHVLHLHRLDHGDAVALGNGITLRHEHLDD